MSDFTELARKLLGQQQDYNSPLPPGATPEQTFTAATMSGRLPVVGAQIQIAQGDLGIAPMNTTGAQRILGVGGRIAGASAVGSLASLLGRASAGEARAIPYEEITAVRRGSGPWLLSPPTVRIQTRDGNDHEIGVTKSLFSLNASRANVLARDAAGSAIDQRAGLEYRPQ